MIASSGINSVTIGTEDRRLKVGTAVARTFTFGSTWTQLIISARVAFTDIGGDILGSPYWAFGVMSAPDSTVSNGPQSSTCTHFLGMTYDTVLTGNFSWTRGAVTPVRYQPLVRFYKKVGTTYTASASSGAGVGTSAAPSTARSLMLLRFTKSGSNMSLDSIFPVFTAPNDSCRDVSKALHVSTVEYFAANTTFNTATYLNTNLGGGGWFGYSGATQNAIAFNEGTDGGLDSLVFVWPYVAFPAYVSEFAYLKVS